MLFLFLLFAKTNAVFQQTQISFQNQNWTAERPFVFGSLLMQHLSHSQMRCWTIVQRDTCINAYKQWTRNVQTIAIVV